MKEIEEQWRSVTSNPTYEVSNLGAIRHVINGLRKPVVDRYLRFRGWDRALQRYILYQIHREVALAFIPNPNNLPQVNHLDGNKHNNCILNLEWCSISDNQLHSTRVLGNRIGKKHGNYIGIWCTPVGKFETVRNAADALGIGYWHIFKWCKQGVSGYSIEKDSKTND